MSAVATAPMFRWVDGWGSLPAEDNGRTHGVAVASDGRVVVFRQADPAILLFTPDGERLGAWGDFPGAHGLTLVDEDGEDRLWLTDEGGEVSKWTLDGECLQRLESPMHPAYESGRYVPTWVAVDERRYGGTGDLWVADGYGQNLVHHYAASGEYLGVLDGPDAAFDCPHAVWVDRRRGDAELWVADRGHKRLQVFTLDGRFLRTVGEGGLECPCTGVPYADGLVVPELCARLTILDAAGALVAFVGRNEAACDLPGWPQVGSENVNPGRFNSPHAAAADADGNLYVAEWIVGGRLTKLERLEPLPL